VCRTLVVGERFPGKLAWVPVQSMA